MRWTQYGVGTYSSGAMPSPGCRNGNTIFPNLHRHRSSERMMQPSISASLRLTNAGLLASCLVFGIHLWNTEYGSGSSGVFLAGLEFQSCVCCVLAGLLSRVCSIDSGLRSAKL